MFYRLCGGGILVTQDVIVLQIQPCVGEKLRQNPEPNWPRFVGAIVILVVLLLKILQTF